MSKLFNVAGIASDKHGNTKVRYANDLQNRLKILTRDQFTNNNLIELPTPMSKIDACKFMLSSDLINTKIFVQEELEKLEKKLKQEEYKKLLST